jgi:hypothetical protein
MSSEDNREGARVLSDDNGEVDELIRSLLTALDDGAMALRFARMKREIENLPPRFSAQSYLSGARA